MSDKEVLELLNKEINELNVKIALSKLLTKTKGGSSAIQILKESIIKSQSDFVKRIETMHY